MCLIKLISVLPLYLYMSDYIMGVCMCALRLLCPVYSFTQVYMLWSVHRITTLIHIFLARWGCCSGYFLIMFSNTTLLFLSFQLIKPFQVSSTSITQTILLPNYHRPEVFSHSCEATYTADRENIYSLGSMAKILSSWLQYCAIVS